MFDYLLLPISVFMVTSFFTYPLVYYFEGKVEQTLMHLREEQVDYANIGGFQQQNYVYEKPEIEMQIRQLDYRAFVFDQYFAKYNSPLEGHGQYFVDACEKYNAPNDCTTLPAIAFVETGLCTTDISDSQKNCWGWGGAPPNRIIFDDYDQAIDRITYGLVHDYGLEYLKDPVKMQYTYCGAHCDNWGRHVQSQRYEIDRLAKSLGYPALLQE